MSNEHETATADLMAAALGFKKISGFAWINKPCQVRGEDFVYRAICLCSFPKSNGKVRYIVEDNGRLFIQRGEQITFIENQEIMSVDDLIYLDNLKDQIRKSSDAMDASTFSGRQRTEELQSKLNKFREIKADRVRHGPVEGIKIEVIVCPHCNGKRRMRGWTCSRCKGEGTVEIKTPHPPKR